MSLPWWYFMDLSLLQVLKKHRMPRSVSRTTTLNFSHSIYHGPLQPIGFQQPGPWELTPEFTGTGNTSTGIDCLEQAHSPRSVGSLAPSQPLIPADITFTLL